MSERIPTVISGIGKETSLYLSQLDQNGAEKAAHLRYLLERGALPEVNGQIRLLEVGVGSAAAFKELAMDFKESKNVQYVGADRSALFAQHFVAQTDSPAVAADASQLPFAANSFSAINASAVMHEVSSYGIQKEVGRELGLQAVESTLAEFARVLAPEGVLCYRDIYCPPGDEAKNVKYERESWRFFADKFLPRFLAAAADIDQRLLESAGVSNDAAARTVTGSPRLHREVQRHYLTFRDFMRRSAFPTAGLRIGRETWLSVEKGIKQHEFDLRPKRAEWIDSEIISAFGNQNEEGYFVLDSASYDDITDELIASYFLQPDQSEFEEWLKREGGELYTYATLDELSNMAASYGLVEDTAARRLAPRQYYQQYLTRVINGPEYEGKQITAFIRKP